VSIRFDLREGRELGLPLCCRLRFALEYALNPDSGQALRRGISLTRDQIEYIPCGILHKPEYTHAEYEVLLNQPGHPIHERARKWLDEETTP
jgi:hypothetical protein